MYEVPDRRKTAGVQAARVFAVIVCKVSMDYLLPIIELLVEYEVRKISFKKNPRCR